MSGGGGGKEGHRGTGLIRLGGERRGIGLVDGALCRAARQWRAGEELVIRTKKYATPRIFIPKASIPKDGRTR